MARKRGTPMKIGFKSSWSRKNEKLADLFLNKSSQLNGGSQGETLNKTILHTIWSLLGNRAYAASECPLNCSRRRRGIP
jgi:hypothetical protein